MLEKSSSTQFKVTQILLLWFESQEIQQILDSLSLFALVRFSHSRNGATICS